MAYAVSLFPDDAAAQRIRALWRRLYDAELALPLWRAGDRPHLTIAIYEDMDVDRLERGLEVFVHGLPPLSLHVPSLGVFPGETATLYLAVTLSEELWALHAVFHHHFDLLCQEPYRLYQPGVWLPHMTLARGLPVEQVGRAIELCLADWRPLRGAIVEIGVTRFEPRERLYIASLPR